MTGRQPPNYRQDNCGYGHGAHAPDVAGSLFGLRAWSLGVDGWLRGATYGVPWGPGWNDAQCLVARRNPGTRPPSGIRFGHGYGVQSGCIFPETPDEPVEYEDGWTADPCRGVDPSCGCGFYAYYDEQHGRTNGYGNIRGVIEATGKMVVGPDGFRAQRARLVAVVAPQKFTPRVTGQTRRDVQALHTLVQLLQASAKDLKVRPWFGGTNRFALLWGSAVVTLVLLGKGASDKAALLGSVALVTSVVGVLTAVSRRRTRRLATAFALQIASGQQQINDLQPETSFEDILPLLREHYPDLKVYPSMVALLADYPTSDVRGLLGLEEATDG